MKSRVNNRERRSLVQVTVPQSKVFTVPSEIPHAGNDFSEELAQFMGRVSPFNMLTDPTKKVGYKGKRSVPFAVLHSSIRMPSNAMREIRYTSTVNVAESMSDFMSSHFHSNHSAVASAYLHTLPRFRGVDDIAFLPNFLVNLVGLTLELGFKTAGAILTQPFHAAWKHAADSNKSYGMRMLAAVGGILATPLWLASMPFFTVGNVSSYVRKITDGVSNVVARAAAVVWGDEELYPSFSASFKTIAKNVLLLAGGGVPLVSGLVHSAIIKVRGFFDSVFSATPSPVSSGRPSLAQVDHPMSSSDAVVRKSIQKSPAVNRRSALAASYTGDPVLVGSAPQPDSSLPNTPSLLHDAINHTILPGFTNGFLNRDNRSNCNSNDSSPSRSRSPSLTGLK